MSHPLPAISDQAPTLFVSDADVAALTEWPAAVEALRGAYSRPISPEMAPPRVMARGKGFWLRGLCAVSPSGEYMGCKLIAASPTIRRASYLISLFDQRTMDLVVLMDGNRVTGIRTAATAALAVDVLAPRAPLKVAVIGSGFEAQGLLKALVDTRTVACARVYSPSPASRQRFVDALKVAARLSVTAADTAEEAVRDANVVLCAARSRDESPVLNGKWLQPGATVVSVGSTLPEQREVDEETLARAEVIVADMPEEVVHETGDGIAAAKRGIDLPSKLVSLAEVVSLRHPGRCSPHSIVVYKSVGTALQDVVIAEMLLRRARVAGRFITAPATIMTIDK